MIPGLYDIKAYRNDTLTKTFTVVDSAGSPVSFATADIKMQVRPKPDGDVMMTLTEGDGLTVGGAGNNVITISRVIDIQGCHTLADKGAPIAELEMMTGQHDERGS